MKRILIVDDAAFMRTSIRKMIEQHNFSIVGEAENGEDAIEKYKKLRPDIVTMDITMPVMNGIEATKAILAFDPNATIIMVSALGQEDYVREAIICGAKNFIVKPFKSETILKALSTVK